jgi:hypothetical protein
MDVTRISYRMSEFCARHNVSRSYAYEEKDKGNLEILEGGIVTAEAEKRWLDNKRRLAPTQPERLLQEAAAAPAEEFELVLDITRRFIATIASMSPTRARAIDRAFQRPLRGAHS